MFGLLKHVILYIVLVSFSGLSHSETVDHSIWDSLLKRHVQAINNGHATVVDYDSLLKEHEELRRYLSELSSFDVKRFEKLGRDEQLAFLINAYNAWTVELILTKYPNLTSIKELGSFFQSPWKKEFIPLLDEKRSLDDIEHNLIRGSGDYNDARIHAAVNCASIGCPALRAEAYIGTKLDAQLEEQMQLFLSDNTRNRFSKNTLEVSPIFKWYREDFEKGWLGINSLEEFFISYAKVLGLTDTQINLLRHGKIDIEFLDYDWRLNKK